MFTRNLDHKGFSKTRKEKNKEKENTNNCSQFGQFSTRVFISKSNLTSLIHA